MEYKQMYEHMFTTRKWTPDPAVYSAEARAALEKSLNSILDDAEKLTRHARAASEDGA
jgi:hypothetical protein